MNIAQKMYLDLHAARGYEEQEPEYIAAKPIHLLWFIVPICGFLGFVGQVKHAYANLPTNSESNQ